MMPPGHVAVTWGVSTLLQKPASRLDYRLLALAAMLPDFIDKPLAMLVFTQAHTSQLVAHSLLFHIAVLVTVLLFWRTMLPYALAFNGHLLADRMWRHTQSFWWPLFGPQTFWEFKVMNTPQAMAAVYWDIITRYPEVWGVELLALAYLARFATRYQLYRWPRLKILLLTGALPPPLSGPVAAARASQQRAPADL